MRSTKPKGEKRGRDRRPVGAEIAIMMFGLEQHLKQITLCTNCLGPDSLGDPNSREAIVLLIQSFLCSLALQDCIAEYEGR